jgi:hypothetical protein
MERGNSKHGPRLDDEMGREVNGLVHGTAGGRAQEWRQAEPPGEDQPEASTTPNGNRRSGTPQGMTTADVEERSRLGRFINLNALPGDRELLISNALENEAPADIIAQLDQLPPDVEFRTISEVWAALGRRNETRRW